MRKRSRYKDVIRFNEIAEILNITFEQAEELFFTLNAKSIDERYLDFVDEVKKDNPFFEFSIDFNKLDQKLISEKYNYEKRP